LFYISQNASDTFGSLIAYGFGILIFFQSVVNIGVNLNVIPVTGLTLPFVSYGGSSLLTLMLGYRHGGKRGYALSNPCIVKCLLLCLAGVSGF
jgi:hypothetical protein